MAASKNNTPPVTETTPPAAAATPPAAPPPTVPPAVEKDPIVRVKFTQTFAGSRDVFVRGKEYTLPRSRVAEFIDKKFAIVQK